MKLADFECYEGTQALERLARYYSGQRERIASGQHEAFLRRIEIGPEHILSQIELVEASAGL